MAPGPQRRPAAVAQDVLEAFRSVAPAVEAFARENNLRLERYRQGRPAWELRFARELGGEAALVLGYRQSTGHVLDLSAIWWIDDLKERSRRLRSEKIAVWDRRSDLGELRRQLETGLRWIDAWTEEDLGPAHGPYVNWGREPEGASPQGWGGQLPRR